MKNYLSFDPIIFPSKVFKFFKKRKVKVQHEGIALSSKKVVLIFILLKEKILHH